MERTDWLDEGFDSGQARFLMVTSITHHRFSSPLWGGDEVRKLHAELAEIELAAAQLARLMRERNRPSVAPCRERRRGDAGSHLEGGDRPLRLS
jgi:hypothetical protein